jgi:hypothetical protein
METQEIMHRAQMKAVENQAELEAEIRKREVENDNGGDQGTQDDVGEEGNDGRESEAAGGQTGIAGESIKT